MVENLSDKTLLKLEHYNQYFKKYIDHLVVGWGDSGKDLEGVRTAVSFVYKSTSYEKKEFCEFVDSKFSKPWSEAHHSVILNLATFFNRCHEDNIEDDLPNDVKEAIENCDLSLSTLEVKKKIADSFKDNIHSFLKNNYPDIYTEIKEEEVEKISKQEIEKERIFKPITENPPSEDSHKKSLKELSSKELSSLITSLSRPSQSPSPQILEPLAIRQLQR